MRRSHEFSNAFPPPRPKLEEVSIIIPTLGRQLLRQCLDRIVRGSSWPAELIIVDQGSCAWIADHVKELREKGIRATYRSSSQSGRAAGVNEGLRNVRTHFVAITDDDCFVFPRWLENLVTCLKQHPNAIVTGRVNGVGDHCVFEVATSDKSAIYHRPRLRFDPLSGGNMGTSMAVLERVGLFDESPYLRTAEDGEWAYRALRSGVPIVYAPEVVVEHYGWRNSAQRSQQYASYARSQGGFYGKYLREGDWFIALRVVFHHLRALRRWVRGVLNGDRETALYGRAYFTGLLPGIVAGLRQRSL